MKVHFKKSKNYKNLKEIFIIIASFSWQTFNYDKTSEKYRQAEILQKYCTTTPNDLKSKFPL